MTGAMQSDDLSGKTCVITGAGQGIGRALALAFAARGAHVLVADINATSAAGVCAEIRARGQMASPMEMDLTDSASVSAAFARAQAVAPAPDILISNARWSALSPTPVQDITDADWQMAMEVNVTGAFRCVRAVVPGMIARGRGRVILVSSSTVRRPPGRPYAHYITTKAALIGMTRALASELGAHGITVNALLPGSVETGIARHIGSQERQTRAAATQAIGRVITAQDLTGAALFLASDAAGFVTGQSLAVDGGYSYG